MSFENPKPLRISVSDLTYFSDCRRQWYWNRTYSSKRPDPRFWLGTITHSGLEGYFKNNRDMSHGMDYFETQVQKSIRDIREEFSPIWSSIVPEFDTLYVTAAGMLQNYSIMDHEDPFQGEIYFVEKYARIPLPGLVGNQSQTIEISGRMDLVLKHKKELHLVDHKTSASLFSPNGLEVDEQMTAYSWMLWKLENQIPEMVTYDVLIKSLPEEPRVLKEKGSPLSLDKGQPTVYSLYLGALQDRGWEKEERYAPMLNYLKAAGWSKYFQRLSSTRNQHELESFEDRARAKALDILRILDNPETFAYPSPSTYRCGGCPFLMVCKSKDDGGDFQYMLDSSFKKGSW